MQIVLQALPPMVCRRVRIAKAGGHPTASIEVGNQRNALKRQVREIVRIFKFGVSMELGETTTWQKLAALDSLQVIQAAGMSSK